MHNARKQIQDPRICLRRILLLAQEAFEAPNQSKDGDKMFFVSWGRALDLAQSNLQCIRMNSGTYHYDVAD